MLLLTTHDVLLMAPKLPIHPMAQSDNVSLILNRQSVRCLTLMSQIEGVEFVKCLSHDKGDLHPSHVTIRQHFPSPLPDKVWDANPLCHIPGGVYQMFKS